jgi:CHAT domain-containing protein
MIFRLLAIIFFLSCLFPALHAQQGIGLIADLDSLFSLKKYAQADIVLKKRIPVLLNIQPPDTLSDYTEYIGKVALELNGKTKAIEAVKQFIHTVKTKHPYEEVVLISYFAGANFFSKLDEQLLAYTILQEADAYFKKDPSKVSHKIFRLYLNSGTYAMRLGKYALATTFYRQAITAQEQVDSTEPEDHFIVNNSMGIAMWYGSKLDSCLYYFKKAEQVLQGSPANMLNKHYRMGMIQNNIANVYAELGQTSASISSLEAAILNYKRFIASPEDNPKKESALIEQFHSMDNLAKSYLDIGDIAKGQHLLQYAYQQKINAFSENNSEVYKSLVYLGALYYRQKDYLKAITTLTKGLAIIHTNATDNNSIWEAEAYAYLAYCYFETLQTPTALSYLQKADAMYKTIVQEDYSTEYLNFLTNAAAIYAQTGQAAYALRLSESGLSYVKKTKGEASLLGIAQLISLAHINFSIKDYKQSLALSKQCISLIDKVVAGSDLLLDSIRIEIDKPRAILIKVKSTYELLPVKTPAHINNLLEELKTSVAIIEKRKSILSEEKDISNLISNYMEVLDFMKFLELELYHHTNQKSKLDIILNIHESAIYTRIRSRLNKQHHNVRFSNIPEHVVEQEEVLRTALYKSLQNSRSHESNVNAYLAASKKWSAFQEGLRKQYPEYYHLRYASDTDFSVAALNTPSLQGFSIVRFLFIHNKLYCLVVNNGKQNWIPLDETNVANYIKQLSNPAVTPAEVFTIAHVLYQKLWQPVEQFISNKRVIIIPDGILYYLSFDMLSVARCNANKDFATLSLLSKYAISYHYSLLALLQQTKQNSQERTAGFAAFTPGFNDDIKKQYRSALKKDSLNIDNAYLSLLPLPFSVSLAQKATQLFPGSLYTGASSTQSSFKQHAGNHAIIHIGTHAEANNQYPEYSRLIFAKDLDHPTSDNSLYLFDIYNYDLSADLAVLTACETGKPGFFPGEGMISMAHAFNYAGSESILTGLWKIDEQASTMITQFFYDKLAEGMTKDEALRQAKLTYLATAEGRMLAPQYWAGLVIMGNTAAIDMKKKSLIKDYWWVLALLAVAGSTAILFYRHKRNNKAA